MIISDKMHGINSVKNSRNIQTTNKQHYKFRDVFYSQFSHQHVSAGTAVEGFGEKIVNEIHHEHCTASVLLFIYRFIQNDCRGFNNLSHKIHLR